MWVQHSDSGQEIHPGDRIIDFLGESWKFITISRFPQGPSSGRLFVENGIGNKREFYPQVFDCEIQPDTRDIMTWIDDDLQSEHRREIDDLNADYIEGR